jgi:hypothetical protein
MCKLNDTSAMIRVWSRSQKNARNVRTAQLLACYPWPFAKLWRVGQLPKLDQRGGERS